MSTLTTNNVLWSKGPHKLDYNMLSTEQMSSEQAIVALIEQFNDNRTGNAPFWVRNSSRNAAYTTDLNFVGKHLEKFQKPFILITSDGDRPVPSSYPINLVEKLLKSPLILAWYSQNYDNTIKHEKLRHWPIGFDLHTTAWFIHGSKEAKLAYMVALRSKTMEKIVDQIFSDWHLHFTHPERRQLYQILQNNKHITFLKEHQPFETITKLYNQFQFVLSPRGNGMDCHRTWELFLAGAIIITKTSPLDQMYIKNQLPVVILQDWAELNDKNLPEKLKQWALQYKPFTTIEHIFPRLTFKYWLST